MKTSKSGFTLVEMMTVVTILWILATIGYTAYGNQIISVRDTTRITHLTTLSNDIISYRAKKDLFLPENTVEIQKSWTVFAYQWVLGSEALEELGHKSEIRDPFDGSFYNYYLLKNKSIFQLMWFLEEERWDKPQDTATLRDLESRDKIPYFQGKKLWILTDLYNTPIQELDDFWFWKPFDVATVSEKYKSHLNSENVVIGDNTVLSELTTVAKNKWKFCKEEFGAFVCTK